MTTAATAKARLTEAIDALRRSTGVDLASPDEDGIVAFALKHEGTVLDFYMRALNDADMVSVMVPLGRVEGPGADVFVGQPLLAANLLGLETNGLSLAFNPGDQSVVLGYSILGKGITADALEEVIGRFAVAARAWRERLAAAQAG
jgi:hypothetical protein